MDHEKAKQAVIRVGSGRGFVVERADGRLVITAGHCLPHLPPCHPCSFSEERTYPELLGALDEEPSVCAECFSVDPVSDLAVLGPPDNQKWWEEADAYDALLDAAEPLSIDDAPQSGSAWLLSWDGRWFGCAVRNQNGWLWLSNAAEGISSGMSGSPILMENGTAIGVVCVSGGSSEVHTGGGPNPRLTYHLPAGLHQQLTRRL